MKDTMKKWKNLFLWLIFIIYEETVFSIAVFHSVKSIGYVILFSVLFSVILHFITSINKKTNVISSYLLVILTIVLFIAQFIYYNIYQAIISFYSATNAVGQIWQFFTTILSVMIKNWYIILVQILPLFIMIILHRKKGIDFEALKTKQALSEFVTALLTQIIALTCIVFFSSEEEIYSNKNLYYNVHAPTISANQMGILTTMRLDLQRMLMGFEEKTTLVVNDNVIVEEKKDEPVEYNKIDIDWDTLIANEKNSTIKSMYQYMSNQEPSKKNEYTGMFEGKNLVVFVAEAFTNLAIDENITPTLYKLYSEGFKFNNFYTPLFPVSTADGEYITDTGLIPKEGVWSLKKVANNYMPYSYANVFEALGYSSQSYHDHTATYYGRDKYLNGMGYDSYLARGTGLEKRMNLKKWPSSDVDMIDVTTQDYLNKDGNFIAYYMTVSGHLEYTRMGNNMVSKNWNVVKDLEYSEKAKGYLAAQLELDRAVELLIQRLEEAGELENTVILISGDHYPYGLTLSEVNELSDFERDDNFEKHRSAALIWSGSMTAPIEVDKIGSSLDILPTMLNLFGVEFDSRLLMGRDILSDSDSLVIYSNRSFITSKGRYSTLDKTFTPSRELEENFNSDEYVTEISNDIYNKYQMSKLILENDFYRKLWTAMGWSVN